MKKMYKIRLQRDFFETCNKWVKWSGLFVAINILSPGSCLTLPRGYIHVLNHIKKSIKSEFKDIFLKLARNEWSDKTFLMTSKLCPLGAVCPCPGVIYMYKIRLQRDFLKLVANEQSDKRFLSTSNFCPLGLSAPDLRLYTSIKSWK